MSPFQQLWSPFDSIKEQMEAVSALYPKEEQTIVITTPPEALYRPLDLPADDIHPIARWYTHVIEGELRLLILRVEQWVHEFELTLLRHQLIHLQEQVVSYLHEAYKKRSHTDKGSTELYAYVYHILYGYLLATLKEIQLRYGHLLGDELIDNYSLYVLRLKQVLPDPPEYLYTVPGLRFSFHKEPVEGKRTEYLEIVYKGLLKHDKRVLAQDGKALLFWLEDQWLYEYMLEEFPELCHSYARKEKLIEELKQEINSSSISQKWLKVLSAAVNQMQQWKYSNDGRSINSEVSVLSLFMATYSNSNHQDKHQKIENKPDTQLEKNILENYVGLFEVQNKLDVSPKTLLKYLKESDIKVVNFSGKTKMIHLDELKKFIKRNIEPVNKESKNNHV
jgi:hypothetical protein